MKKLFIPLFMLIGMTISIHAQEKSRKELKGDKYVFIYAYTKAINAYTHTKNLTLDGERHLAECYHKTDQNVKAEEIYTKLVAVTPELSPEDYYNYAMVLKMNGKYDESAKWMEKFELAKPEDLRAKSYANNKMDFNSLILDDSNFKILSMDINTESDDFGPSYYQNKIVFSSTRSTASMFNRKYNWNGEPFLDLYASELDGLQLKEPERFDKSLNTKWHDGPASFNADGTFMAFTRNNCKDKSKDKIVELQICFSSHTDGKWSEIEPFIFNNPEYSVGQPHLTADGKTMYFASDMPGGFGKADIYKTTKSEKGEWSKPENLGNKINTEGEEMFPFFEEKNSLLFFASDGHNGFGGLDIFMCLADGAQFGRVSNIGFPLNTRNDDFSFIVNDSLKHGYFSSNRSTAGFDNIYSVEILKMLENGKKIQGIAKDKNGAPVLGTFVTLTNDKTNLQDTLITKEDGTYSFLTDSNQNFKLTGEKEGYITAKSNPTTSGKEQVITADLILLEKFKIDSTHLTVGTDLTNVINAKATYDGDLKMDIAYFDLDKFNIRPDAAKELDKIAKIMNDFPAIVIELSSYTDCSASQQYNQVLSEKRAKSSVDYIKSRITHPERISGSGYGETKLLNGCNCEGVYVSSCPDDENQLNRRTEFIIMKN